MWSTQPYYLLSGPFQKTFAIPAAEHMFLPTTLISRSFVLVVPLFIPQLHIHLITVYCQFFLQRVSNVALLLSSLQLSEVGILSASAWADKTSCSVTSLLPSQALDSFCTNASYPFPHHSTENKGSICTGHGGKWMWLLRAGGGWLKVTKYF